MFEKFKESEFYKKLTQAGAARTAVVCAAVVLLVLTVVLTVTLLANRARKDKPLPSPVETGSGAESESATRPIQRPQETETVTDDKPTSADGALPDAFLAPVAVGTLGKGHDTTVQVFSQTMQDFRVHLGIDVAATTGADVRATADGVVSKIWDDPMMGTCMAITHSGDCCTVYKNLAPELAEGIEEGCRVFAGQTVAFIGDSAMIEAADEPHLHMEMTVGGLAVDPMDYLDRAEFGAADVYEDGTETESDSSGK